MAKEQKVAEWEIRQSRTFEKWCNMYLAKKQYKPIEDGEILGAFENGIKLMELTNALYSTPFPKKVISEAKCKNRIMQQTNVAQALKMLEKAEVKTHFLKAGHLMDKERKFILGMIWSIILDYNLKGLGEENTTAKEGLLIWCRKKNKRLQRCRWKS